MGPLLRKPLLGRRELLWGRPSEKWAEGVDGRGLGLLIRLGTNFWGTLNYYERLW